MEKTIKGSMARKLSAQARQIDRSLLITIIALMLLGALMVTSSSPAIGSRIDLSPLHFAQKHLTYLMIAIPFLVLPAIIKSDRLIIVGGAGLYLSMIILLVLTLTIGPEIKGAQRWIAIGGIGLQPSELIKPAFIICNAWILSGGLWRPLVSISRPGQYSNWALSSWAVSLLIFLPIGLLLILQPDFGMSLTFASIWGAQIFVAGLPFILVGGLIVIILGGGVLAYLTLPHVASRIDRFMSPQSGDNYQLDMSIRAINEGGWLGKGPSEGVIKYHIPDSHADFIFPVIVEEYGLIGATIMIGLLFYLVYRILRAAWLHHTSFGKLSLIGCGVTISFQTFVNIGSAIGLIPTKGMTIPFVSYGGSSLIAMSLLAGIALCLSKHDALANTGSGTGSGTGSNQGRY